MSEFFSALLSYGQGPVLIVLCFLMIYVIKKLTSNESEGRKKDKALLERDSQMKDFIIAQITTQVKDIEDRNKEQLSGVLRHIEDLGQRMNVVERDYMQREEFYREFSGWRGEISKLDKKFDQTILVLAKMQKEVRNGSLEELDSKFNRLIDVLLKNNEKEKPR